MTRKSIFSILSIVLVFSCWEFIYAQDNENNGFKLDYELLRGCKECRRSGGSCKAVIESLRLFQNNDSIAIEIFKEEYEIVNMRYYEKEWLLRKNHIEIIKLLTLEENKKYYCRSKHFNPYNPILLVD